jgi:hypothetical protein
MVHGLARSHLEEEHGFVPEVDRQYHFRSMHERQHLNEGQFLNHTHPDLAEPAPKYQPTLGDDWTLFNDRRS